MLIAKCDRCGAEITAKKAYREYEVNKIVRRPFSSGIQKRLELCKDCQEDLQEFINGKGLVARNALKIQLDDGAIMPERAHPEDAGLDLFTPEVVHVPAKGSATIDTGVHVQLPEGTAGVLMSKSGLNVNLDITNTGLIDEGYTGSIKVKLYNHGDRTIVIGEGRKISQLVIVPVQRPVPIQVEQITGGERGTGGFGSTGK